MREGFRPLAGFWFLNYKDVVMVWNEYLEEVSVPLRGSGS